MAAETLDTMTVTTPSDTEIVATYIFDAPRTLVFEAWTKPEHIRRWMLGPEEWTMPVCEVDVRPGGSWHYVWRKADGQEMGMRGTYREVQAPERLATTEQWEGPWPETLETLVFTEKGGRTTVVATIQYPTREARDAALGTGMTKGMAVSFDRLATLLGSMA